MEDLMVVAKRLRDAVIKLSAGSPTLIAKITIESEIYSALVAERERCLAACRLGEREIKLLYSAETARWVGMKISKGTEFAESRTHREDECGDISVSGYPKMVIAGKVRI